MNEWILTEDGTLCHHGIKGQKWGVRRFQNEDGTLTSLGKSHNKSIKSSLTSTVTKMQDAARKRDLEKNYERSNRYKRSFWQSTAFGNTVKAKSSRYLSNVAKGIGEQAIVKAQRRGMNTPLQSMSTKAITYGAKTAQLYFGYVVPAITTADTIRSYQYSHNAQYRKEVDAKAKQYQDEYLKKKG